LDPVLSDIIPSIPNLAVAVWVIFNYQKTISNLLQNQQKLVEQLMALHPPQPPPPDDD